MELARFIAPFGAYLYRGAKDIDTWRHVSAKATSEEGMIVILFGKDHLLFGYSEILTYGGLFFVRNKYINPL